MSDTSTLAPGPAAEDAVPTSTQETEDTETDDGGVEKCCRICRGTEEDADESELGRLIRPCACKGSLLYVHEKCQELWIKTYLRRSDKTPACEVCGQQFRISFTKPHRGLVRFLFSSQSPPLVHSIYLTLLYAGLYAMFLFASEHHIKLITFCAMVAVGLGATAALFWITAFRQVDRQILAYYIVPTLAFAIVIFSQFMGYASLYYKWLSYPGILSDEDTEYKNFLKQMNWKSSIGVLLEGISSTSIILNGGLILCISSIRVYKFFRLLYRNGGSLANVWMTASDSTRATLIGALQFCIFLSFYATGPVGKCVSFLVYVAFVVATNWLLRSRFSQHVDTGLCRVSLILGYSFVATVLMGIGINHYILQLAEETGFEAKALASEEFLAAMNPHDEAARPLDVNPARMSSMFAKKFIRYFYDKSAREDHFEYWNQVFYLSFFLLQTLGIFAVGVWIHGRAIWVHFKEWQNVRRQQQLMQLRDELMSKLEGMQRQHQELLDAVRHNINTPAAPEIDVQHHIRHRQQFDEDNGADDIITRETEQTMRRVRSNLGRLGDEPGGANRTGGDEEPRREQSEEELLMQSEDEEGEEKQAEEPVVPEETTRTDEDEEEEQTVKGKEKADEVDTDADGANEVREELVVADDQEERAAEGEGPIVDARDAPQTNNNATGDAENREVGDRLQAGARDFVAGVRSIDEIVAHYLSERRAESQASLFLQYLRSHLSPLSAPEKVRIIYSTLIYLVLFNSVYFSLVVIDPEETKRVWLRFVMDCVGMLSILCFLHFNYLAAPDRHLINHADAAGGNMNNVENNNNNNNNGHRNYGLLLIGHAAIYFALILVWITVQPMSFFDPSLRHLPDDTTAAATTVHPLPSAAAPPPPSSRVAEDHALGLVQEAETTTTTTGNLRLDLDLLLLEQASRDPYALHSLKVMSLLMLISLIEYALIAVGLTAKRLVGIYRIWLHTGTGHFVVHDIAEPQTQGAPRDEDRPELRPEDAEDIIADDDDEDDDSEADEGEEAEVEEIERRGEEEDHGEPPQLRRRAGVANIEPVEG